MTTGQNRAWRSVVALTGGVGGAKLVDGLAQALPPGVLTAVVNTGDDFEHWGLHVSPDLDTNMYTLGNLAHVERGWGLADESFRTLEMIRRYGGDAWFQIGDRDLGTHLVRTQALRRGETLTRVTTRLCEALGVGPRLLPMADGWCRTMIETDGHGTQSFQDWFVLARAAPAVRAIRWEGDPPATPEVLAAIDAAEVVIIGPSNPYVSIDPILTRAGVREALLRKRVIALSPIVGGQAVKGPLATMIPQLTGQPASAAAIARHYEGLLAGLMVEHGDEAGLDGLPIASGRTIMTDRPDRARLAREVLDFAGRIVG